MHHFIGKSIALFGNTFHYFATIKFEKTWKHSFEKFYTILKVTVIFLVRIRHTDWNSYIQYFESKYVVHRKSKLYHLKEAKICYMLA